MAGFSSARATPTPASGRSAYDGANTSGLIGPSILTSCCFQHAVAISLAAAHLGLVRPLIVHEYERRSFPQILPLRGLLFRRSCGFIPTQKDTNGHLGTTTSSSRFKDQIKPMDKASEAILALKPVTFVYKKEIDSERMPQFGLVAEKVAKVNPDLVARDAEGKPYTVRYEAVNAMLLNEFLKEHRKVEELEATVTQLQAAFKAQAAEIRRVNAQVELNKPAARVVATNQ